MLRDGLDEAEVTDYLLGCPWFQDYGRHSFGVEPEDFVEPLLAEMLRSEAARWRDGRLVVLAPYNAPPADWPSGPPGRRIGQHHSTGRHRMKESSWPCTNSLFNQDLDFRARAPIPEVSLLANG